MAEIGEGPQLVSGHFEQDQVIIPDQLPTTQEIAQKGKHDFQKIYEQTTDMQVKNFLENNPFIRNCFVGVQPEIELGSDMQFLELNDIQRDSFIASLNGITEDIQFIADSFHYEGQPAGYAVINLLAAEHVIKNNSDVFPDEALENPREWIINSRHEWIQTNEPIKELRYGLLSGFPRRSCEQYAFYIKVVERLNRDILSTEETELFDKFWEDEIEKTPDVIVRMTEIFQKSVPDITEQELGAMLSRHPVHHISNNYVGFDRVRDEVFAMENDKILYDSGILDVN